MMNSPIITINPSKSISYAKETTQEKDFRRLSVVDNKAKILCIINKNIFRAIPKNQVLVPNFESDQILIDQQLVYSKFTDSETTCTDRDIFFYMIGGIIYKIR